MRRYISLIEILLIMMLIGMVGSIVSVNIYRSLKEERFTSEVQLILERMQLAQDLMLYCNYKNSSTADIRLTFSKREKKWKSHLDIYGHGIPKNIIEKYEGSTQSYQYIGKIIFKNAHQDLEIFQEEMELIFASSGGKMSKGHLIMYPFEGSYSDPLIISLRGYQSPLKVLKERITFGENHVEIFYPQELQE